MALASLLTAARAQSLGDVVREQRQDAADKPKARRVVTNDDLPSLARSAVAAATPTPAPGAVPRKGASAAPSAEAKTSANGIWSRRISEAQLRVTNLQAELADLERTRSQDYQAARHADAAVYLQDPVKRQEEQQRLATEIDQKGRELTDARRDLEDTQARARQAGYTPGP
jgi:hypothetical protein